MLKMDGTNREQSATNGQGGISTVHNHQKAPESGLLLSENKRTRLLNKTSVEPVDQSGSENVHHESRFVDHGWAWMVMFGCALMHFLVGGFARSYSLIYMYLQERFDSSAAVTAWVGGASSAIRMLTSPVATGLSNKYSARTVVMIGGIFCGFGGILSAFATSTEYMFFSYSFFEGLGGALVYAPGIVIVGQYFDKYRSIAMGLASAGSGLGAFCYPPLMQLLFNHYGFFGAMLVTGAVMFNNVFSGAVYRPLPQAPSCRTSQEQSTKTSQNYVASKEESSNLDKAPDYTIVGMAAGHSSNEHEVASSDCKKDVSCCSCLRRLNKYVDLRLFKNPTFVMYVLSLGLITLSYISAQMLLPAYANNQGVSHENSVWLISVIGICDMIGRIASGFLFDVSTVRRHRRHYYDAAILVSGITHFMIAMSRQYVAFLVVSVLHGFFTGVVVSQRAVICTDLMGIENLSSSFGLTIFVQGTGILIGPVTAGLIKDHTSSYFFSYIFTGVCSVIAAVFLFAEWLFIAQRGGKKRNRKAKIENAELEVHSPAVSESLPYK